MKFEEFVENVNEWGIARNIMSAEAQIKKLKDEISEMEESEALGDLDESMDAVGDALVVLTNYCRIKKFTMMQAAEHAWNQIKTRKGITIG